MKIYGKTKELAILPRLFKYIISEMNPLFKGIQTNYTKDLLLFNLEAIHNELNEIKNINYNYNHNRAIIIQFFR